LPYARVHRHDEADLRQRDAVGGWQQCGDGVTCGVKRPYRARGTVTGSAAATEYAIETRLV
jgi:hypothetical protein